MCRFEVILFKEVAKCFIEKREKQELRFLLGERMGFLVERRQITLIGQG